MGWKKKEGGIKELTGLFLRFRPMVSESINNSLFHQLAEQLQQQNLEQFQKQILEHQQHQQKVKETEDKTTQLLLYTAYFIVLEMSNISELT